MNKETAKQSNQRGYALIVLIFFFAIVLALSTSEIYVSSGVALREVNLRIAREYVEESAIAASAPILDDVDKQVMTLVQESLMDHIQKAKLGTTYQCQDGASSGETELSSHYALCDPVHVLSDVDGATNQSLNDIEAFLPDYKEHANDPKYQAMAHYLENSYEYSLTPIFVGEELVDPGGKPFKVGIGSATMPRQERYRFLVRANITMHGYDHVNWKLRANYDVILNTQLQSSGGFGDTCDMQDMNASADLELPIVVLSHSTDADGKPVINACDGGTDCLGIGVYDSTGKFFAYGTDGFTTICGSDGKKCSNDPGVKACQVHVSTVALCGLSNGSGYSFSVFGTRQQRRHSYLGCVGQNTSKNQLGGMFRLKGPASQKAGSAPNDNRLSRNGLTIGSKIAAKDAKSLYGYTFNTVVKLVSVGNPYD